jgi:hypothetical protein
MESPEERRPEGGGDGSERREKVKREQDEREEGLHR